MIKRLQCVLIFALLGMMLVVPQKVDAIKPSVTYDITQDAEVKTYTYMITNTLNEFVLINDFWIYMPEAGVRAVTSVTCSNPSFHAYWGRGYWGIAGENLPSGATMLMVLTTAADVTTLYDYDPSPDNGPGAPTNWGFGDHYASMPGDTILPVPSGIVPEPSGFLALLCGIGGIGGLWLWQRK